MNKTFRYALATVLGLGMAVSAMAQNFPDVPDNHWAYEALERMKSDGLLVGYPDDLFRGGRPATRYEMAVAIHATYMHLKNLINNLDEQVKNFKGGDDSWKAAVADLQSQINAMKNWCEKLSDDKYKRWVKLLTRLSLAERQGKDNSSAPTSRANDSR